jgi:hypothetical protein
MNSTRMRERVQETSGGGSPFNRGFLTNLRQWEFRTLFAVGQPVSRVSIPPNGMNTPFPITFTRCVNNAFSRDLTESAPILFKSKKRWSSRRCCYRSGWLEGIAAYLLLVQQAHLRLGPGGDHAFDNQCHDLPCRKTQARRLAHINLAEAILGSRF